MAIKNSPEMQCVRWPRKQHQAKMDEANLWGDVPDEIIEDLYVQLQPSASIFSDPSDGMMGEPFAFSQLEMMPGEVVDEDSRVPQGLTVLPPLPDVGEEVKVARKKITSAEVYVDQLRGDLSSIRMRHIEIVTVVYGELRDQVIETYEHMVDQCVSHLTTLNAIFSSVVLDYNDVSRLLDLRHQIQYIKVNIVLLLDELRQMSLTPSLVIMNQPVPSVIFKGKPIEDVFSLSLVLSPGWDPEHIDTVSCHLTNMDGSKAAKPTDEKHEDMIQNGRVKMDEPDRQVAFQSIKIMSSSRMNIVALYFHTRVSIRGASTVEIVSQLSNPIVVITNESQWVEAAGKIILNEAFATEEGGGKETAPWPYVINVLNTHFLKITRQNPTYPKRGLNRGEIEYLHKKFCDGNQQVSVSQVKGLWNWFGEILRTLRFKRHVGKMWMEGMIYGFITKRACEEILRGEEPGTFIIRFSEQYAGQFAVAYVDADLGEPVKHTLILEEDISAKKSLPDFLGEKTPFQFLRLLDPVTGGLSTLSKDSVLANLYSKHKRNVNPQSGYVLL